MRLLGLRLPGLRNAKHIGVAIIPGGVIHIVGRILDDSRLALRGSVGFNLLALNIIDAGGAHTWSVAGVSARRIGGWHAWNSAASGVP